MLLLWCTAGQEEVWENNNFQMTVNFKKKIARLIVSSRDRKSLVGTAPVAKNYYLKENFCYILFRTLKLQINCSQVK